MENNNNNFVGGNNKDLTKKMLLNKSLCDVKGLNPFSAEAESAGDIGYKLSQYEYSLGNQSIHKLISMPVEDVPTPMTLMSYVDGSKTRDMTLVNLQSELIDYCNSTPYNKAKADIKKAKDDYNNWVNKKDVYSKNLQSQYDSVKATMDSMGQFMNMHEKKSYHDQLMKIEALIVNPQDDSDLQAIEKQIAKAEDLYVKAICKCRYIVENYPNEVKQLEAEQRLKDLRDGKL